MSDEPRPPDPGRASPLQRAARRARRSAQRVRRIPAARRQLQVDNQRLREQVQRLQQAQRGRDDLGYLFIVTYGRSGSTLLLGLLNQIPGYLIRGENRAALRHLHAYHRVLMAERSRHRRRKSRRTTYPWFGIADVPPGRLTQGVRRLAVETLLRPEDDTRVTGFKEIRWRPDDLEEHVAWLREAFPGARFVINTRRVEDVLRSRWWAEGDPEQNEAVLRRADEQVRALADALGDAAFHVHYDDYVADPTTLRGLYDWLGEPWDESAVRQTLAIPHSIPTVRRGPSDAAGSESTQSPS